MSSEKDVSAEAQLEACPSNKSHNQRDIAADEAQRVDTSLTIKDAFRYYWKAVAWSLAMSMATIMESYDLLLITSFFAFPKFQEKYGVQLPDGRYSVEARWQVALSVVTNVGMIVGVFINGYCADKWGLRKTLMGAHVTLAAFVFINFFAPSVEVLTVGTLLL